MEHREYFEVENGVFVDLDEVELEVLNDIYVSVQVFSFLLIYIK